MPFEMNMLTTASPVGALSAADIRYIRQHYLTLSELSSAEGLPVDRLTALVLERRLPRPAYALPDGTPMFPRDLLGLYRSARGATAMQEHFRVRFEAVARLNGPVQAVRADAEWEGYLSGEYGICLWQVTPETIFLKELLVSSIESQLRDERPEDPAWRTMLAEQVRVLDALERPFTECDRARFGRPTSRERLIETPRRRFHWLASSVEAASTIP